MKWVLKNKNETLKLRTKSFEWINQNRHLFDIKKITQRYSEVFNLDT